MFRRVFCAGWCLVASACRSHPSGSEPAPLVSAVPAAAPVTVRPIATPAEEWRDQFDLIPNLSWCEVEHEGLLLDLGTPIAAAYQGFGGPQSEDSVDVERDGQTFTRATGRALRYDFWLDDARTDTSISVRAFGAAAKWLGATIDDKRVGSVKLVSGETRVLTFPALAAELKRGHHRLKLSFTGAGRGQHVPQAEIDWIRIGTRGDDISGYAAPTLSDIVGDVVLDGAPKRALVLRPASTVRCWVRPAPDARLKVALGFWGAGKGSAEVRVVADGEEPVVLQTRRVAGGDSASWTPAAVDLAPFAGKVVGIEFRATEGSRGGRVAFGDPSISRKNRDPIPSPRAKIAILLVESGMERRRVPPFGPSGKLLTLGDIGRNATSFSHYRAPSAAVGSVFASLLSGLSPRAHRVEDPNARVADSIQLLSEMVKQASGRTAFFTGVPNSFAAFGFNAGWDTFEMVSPVSDLPATEPLSRAMKWLQGEIDDERSGPRLLVVHARGAHPPWDLSRDEVQGLKPEEYSGIIDARRGAIMLAALRTRKRNAHHLQDDDWVRLRAFEDAALGKEDSELQQLVTLLKKKNAWDKTLLVIAGDVAAGEPPEMPFDPQGPLSEERLSAPLIVKFPNGELAGQDEAFGASAADINATILTALGLPVPEGVEGTDLYRSAHERGPIVLPPLVATSPGHYSTRFGSWLLRGELGKIPTLCAMDLDPACVNDVFDERPFAARALWLATFRAERAAATSTNRPKERVAAELDPDTVSALTVWGDLR